MVENQLNCGFYFSELYAMLLEPVVFFQALLFYINSYFDLSKNVLKLHCCFYLNRVPTIGKSREKVGNFVKAFPDREKVGKSVC